ncbi:MAG: FAD-binding protein [Oscillospiraceae bacterium]
MKILVCFKVMPNWDRVLEEDWEQFDINTDISYAGIEYNCFDQSALELGLQIKNKMAGQEQESTCTALTIGDTLPDNMAQNLYSLGFDEVVLIEKEKTEFATYQVADILAQYARDKQYDLILTGSVAGMAETGMVPFLLAEKLGLSVLSEIETATICEQGIAVTCRKEDGLWQQIATLPLLLTVGNSPAVLRCSSLRARLSFKGVSAKKIAITDATAISMMLPQLSCPKSIRKGKMLYGKERDNAEEILNLISYEKADSCEQKIEHDFNASLPENTVVYEFSEDDLYCIDEVLNNLVADWKSKKPKLAIFEDTQCGRQLAVKLASKVGCKCMTKGTVISTSESNITLQKRACASNLIWTQSIDYPAVITLKQPLGNVTRVQLKAENSEHKSWLIEQKLIASEPENLLQKAKLVFVCGAGMGSKQACDKVRELAKKIGAGFGLTRPVALNGWGSTSEIIGQSGKIISPSICLALGTAGAGAFLVGIEGAKKIIAVNTDSNALIFKNADIGIKMDAIKFVDAMIQVLESRSDDIEN